RFLAGHVGATLAVAAIVLPAAALGSSSAAAVARAPDFGVSAGLAAVAGALVVVVWRRAGPVPGGLLLAGIVGFFVVPLLLTTSLGHHLSETEHLIAAGLGIVLERRSRGASTRKRLPTMPLCPARSWWTKRRWRLWGERHPRSRVTDWTTP